MSNLYLTLRGLDASLKPFNDFDNLAKLWDLLGITRKWILPLKKHGNNHIP